MQILLSEATDDSQVSGMFMVYDHCSQYCWCSCTVSTVLIELLFFQSNVIDHLKKKYYALKEENQDLKVQLNLVQSADSVGSGQQQPHGHGGHGPESLLGVTKKLATRVKSSVQTVIPAPAPGGVSPEQELEVGMARAREGAEALREIVMPLEEQIVALKGKLRETDGLLQEYERRHAGSLLEMEAVAASGEGEAGQGEARQLVAEVGEGYSGGEGELHHAMLAARIGMLVQQLDTVTWARDQAARDLEAERRRGQADRDKAERLAGVAAVTREQLSRVRSQLTDQQKEQLGALWSEETQQTTASSSVGERVISPEEWAAILARLDTRTLDQETATHPEQDTQEAELKTVSQERDHLRDNCAKYQEDLKSEAAFR